ncbi:MAG: hypothetical protein ACLR8Y_03500 [Alistipes indistinctus]
MDFYAWAPADVAATGAYPALSIAYEVPANANKDFTIAAPQLGLTSGTVGLSFFPYVGQNHRYSPIA